MIAALQHVLLVAALVLAACAGLQLLAWAMHKYTLLGAFNLYPLVALSATLFAVGVVTGIAGLELVSGGLTFAVLSAAVTGARRRMQALNAGGMLREHELSRRWVWQPGPLRAPGEHARIGRQGEITRVRPWRADVAYVSLRDASPPSRLTGRSRDSGPRLPLGEGRHVFLVGATGAGKTTTARRLVAARVLEQRSSLVILDQKGDARDVEEMRRLAAAAGVAFVLFDSQDPSTDRWQPLWGTPSAVAARAVEAIKQSEPYYYDILRKHLDVVCNILHAADHWPPSVPFLIDACDPSHYPVLLGMARGLAAVQAPLIRRAERHARWMGSLKSSDLAGGAVRLETALALASSRVVTPRITPDGDAVAVQLVQALRQRAVVMFRTHADTMPDEAAALTTVALADLHAAAESDVGPWTLLMDEFGAVINTAADRALAILQRGRTHHGQAVLITQSVADVEALTGTTGLLDSLSDNFAAVVAHRQTSPDSRDWLARLMGTRELWQHTNQTDGHGSRLSGRGSSRRVHEFRVAPDTFASLDQGEAVIYTPEALQAQRTHISPVILPATAPARIDPHGPRHAFEIGVHPETVLALPATAPAHENRDDDQIPPDDDDPHTGGDGHPFDTI